MTGRLSSLTPRPPILRRQRSVENADADGSEFQEPVLGLYAHVSLKVLDLARRCDQRAVELDGEILAYVGDLEVIPFLRRPVSLGESFEV